MDSLIKYTRTRHLEGSRLQEGDDGSDQTPYRFLAGKYIVVEEKIDGANSGVSFPQDAELHLQSRGHYLTGGWNERHFNMFKRWAAAFETDLYTILDDQFLMYGEWMYTKHTDFYDQLPHYFFEFDIYDRSSETFLSTAARRAMLKGSPVVSVPVLYEGIAPKTLKELLAMIKPSLYKTDNWRDNLAIAARRAGVDPERAAEETRDSNLMEGLYIKVEEGNKTVDRLKWVCPDFVQKILDSDSHWQSRPIIVNQLAPGVDIFLHPDMQVTPEVRQPARIVP